MDLGNEIKQIKSYNEAFESKIKSILNDEFVVRFISKPSSSPEYLFQIEKSDDSQRKLHTLILHENLWRSKNRDSVKVHSYKRDFNCEISNQLDQLFKIATDSTKFKRIFSINGEDGTFYYFIRQTSISDMNCGMVWSPPKASTLRELVAICEEIIRYGTGENVKIELISEKINILSLRLKY